MCDTVCVLRDRRTLFAKNSDRPVGEPQVIEVHPRRQGGGTLRTQYLEIDDAGASAVLGSRPTWLWGFEHGVNEHRVAIGNEKVWTVDDPAAAAPALIGMDLVRLGLERSATAPEAVDVMTALLEEHGQGGIADQIDDEAYFSSFLVADPRSAWVLETSGRTWAARPVPPRSGQAISNRISLGDDWERASGDVAAGSSFDAWRDRSAWSAIADVRLACTVPAVTGDNAADDPADLAALLRHHGERPWGRPGADPRDLSPLPDPQLGPEAQGVTVCMHVRGYQTTAASMIAELADDDGPLRAWVLLGSPCAGVYLPVFPFTAVADQLAEATTWHRFDALRARAEATTDALSEIRAVLAPLEAELWEEADLVATGYDVSRCTQLVQTSWDRVESALDRLGV